MNCSRIENHWKNYKLMLDKERIAEVIEAKKFAPVTDETRNQIADALGIKADKVLLGSRVICIVDGSEVYRLQVAETGVVRFLETDIELAEAVLNDAVQRDPVGMWLLINNRVQTNEQMAQSGTILPGAIQTGSGNQFTLSALDLLNGVLYAMSGYRLVPHWDTTDMKKGEARFDGFQISKSGPGTVDFGGEEGTVKTGGTN
jgi:hypothetical protein